MSKKTEDVIQELESELEVSNDISDIKWFDIPVLIIFFMLFLIVASQFISRYVFNDSIGWTEEIARYALIILGFVGSIRCVSMGKHIFLEFFYRYLNVKVVKFLVVFVEALVGGFFAFFGYLSVHLGNESVQNMASIKAPKSIIYYIVAAACFITIIFIVLNILKYIRSSAEDIYSEKLSIKD